MAFAFENLHVYQKAVDFADTCCELPGSFPRGYYLLADQLKRAALSISANLSGPPAAVWATVSTSVDCRNSPPIRQPHLW